LVKTTRVVFHLTTTKTNVLVVKGRFRMEFRDRTNGSKPVSSSSSPRRRARPVAEEECWMSFRARTTLNTGNVETNVPCASRTFDVSCPNVETQFITNANHCLLRPWCPAAARPSASSTAAISLTEINIEPLPEPRRNREHTGKRAIPQFVIDGEWSSLRPARVSSTKKCQTPRVAP